ncbi:hypothetical protein BKA69DRAFT_1179379 [Paraphysoderma sedebokerense]|nr:hypothetical protein BKA69DRAFT_1179379 [Paraphysoderma sedebokerense]
MCTHCMYMANSNPFSIHSSNQLTRANDGTNKLNRLRRRFSLGDAQHSIQDLENLRMRDDKLMDYVVNLKKVSDNLETARTCHANFVAGLEPLLRGEVMNNLDSEDTYQGAVSWAEKHIKTVALRRQMKDHDANLYPAIMSSETTLDRLTVTATVQIMKRDSKEFDAAMKNRR